MATGLFNLKQVNQAISQGAWSGYIAPRWVEYLVVAGGGAGYQYGGGGAGGLLTGIVTVASGASYTVTVGGGGANTGQNSGTNSVFGSISTTGGGAAGVAGGSGGGANDWTFQGTQGVSGQGNAGGAGGNGPYTGGGGGGAGTVGLKGATSTAGNGGAGISSSISGTVVTYAGGGGGGIYQGTTQASGGVGGGGTGGAWGSSPTYDATSGGGNTGGGGGGVYSPQTAGSGGSGIVVVRYPGNVQFFTGGTVTYSNGYIVHNFTANGTLAPTTPTVVSEYQISRSLRFNPADSAYLNRTPGSATNQRTWTWSAWVKRSTLDDFQTLFSASSSGSANYLVAIFFADNKLDFAVYGSGGAQEGRITSTAVYRDVSAWYHVVAVMDTTQATSSDRLRFYVNGVQVTALGTASYPTQNNIYGVNSTVAHTMGTYSFNTSLNFFKGYMTEINFVDGQALTPTSFGYVNPTTGIWSPAKFVGGYGTNGFYLNFSDNSNTTAATLGKDNSGNGNNYTPTNFSVTAGAGNDSLVDSPTSYGTDTGVGGTVRGNYATLNPLVVFGTSTFTNGNLDVSVSSTNTNNFATIAIPTSGKWYWEYQITAIGGGAFPMAGIIASGDSGLTNNVVYRTNGDKNINGTGSAYGATYTTTDIIGVAVDVDGGTITFYKNGTSQGAITYATSSGNYSPALRSNAATDNFTFNFGQRAFANTAPSGFKALCTQNLPTPTIGATTATLATQYFNPALYTGTNATQSITTGFQPDLVWIKSRSAVSRNTIFDAVRGVTKVLWSDSTDAEGTANAGTGLTSLNSTGFTLGTEIAGTSGSTNVSGVTYVAWNWRASNTTAVTNTSGSITSTVSANTTAGFSIVTYASTTGTVGHGLGVVPSVIIMKGRNVTDQWAVYHISTGNTIAIPLNTTGAGDVNSAFWNNTTPTSTVFSQGSWDSGYNKVAYCFAPVAGYSAFGSYTGNGSADGTFVYLGFRPAFVMVKRTDSAQDWFIWDSSRIGYNMNNYLLFANSTQAEYTSTESQVDLLSNGFKLRAAAPPANGSNASGGTYIYMAFASNPFKTSLAR